ncbi:MAG: hypothetical protein JSU68_06090 [Phycisphaerales bacterium]|nr:MAG: hypothetical protein JSU68_06090 [Phycisphaerales bacterium]
MRVTLPTLLVCGLTAGVYAGQPATQPGKAENEHGNPKEILAKAAAALKEVKHAQYRALYQGTGWFKAYTPHLEGTAIIGEASEHDIVRFRVEVRMTPARAFETIELTAGSDGEIFYVIDTQKKLVYADADEAVLGTRARDPRRVLMYTFVSEDPLASLLEAEDVELREDVEISGEPCFQIHVPRPDERDVTWCLSKNDFLPRRVEAQIKSPWNAIGTTQVEIHDLIVETECRPEVFRLSVPEGFTRTDDFAP